VKQVFGGADIKPGLSEDAGVDFILLYEVSDKAAQVISFAFSAIAGQQGKNSRRKDINARGDEAGVGLCRLFLELNYAIAIQADDAEMAGFAHIADIIDSYQDIFTVVGRDEFSQAKLEVVITRDDQEVFGDVLISNPELKRADSPLLLPLSPDIFNTKLYLPGSAFLPAAEISFKLSVARDQYIDVSGNPVHDMTQQRLAFVFQQCLGFIDGQRIKPGTETASQD